MRARLVVAAVALLASSCKRSPPASAPEQDALWKLAPLTATRGVVITKRGLVALEGAWLELYKQLEGTPELRGLLDLLRETAPALVTGEVSLASAGLAPDRGGAAFFFSESGARVAVLPVIDRDKFVEFMHGTKADDGDTIVGLTCRTIRGRYACATPVELLDRLGGGTLADNIRWVGSRGDVEYAVDEDRDTRSGFVIELDRGSLLLRGALRSKSLTASLANGPRQSLDARTLAGFGIANVAPALRDLPIPAEPLTAGVSLADFVHAISGPIVFAAPVGAQLGELRVPLKTAAMARDLAAHCDDIPYLAIMSSTVSDGVCHLSIPGASLEFDVRADGAVLRAASATTSPTTGTLRPSALAKELAGGVWAYSMYGRGTLLGAIAAIPPDWLGDDLAFGFRVMTWINEVGVGVRVDGNVLRLVLGARTVWSNPDELVARLHALPFEQIVDPGAIAAATEIAATAPDAPLADDVKAGAGLLPALAVMGFIGGIATSSVAPEIGELVRVRPSVADTLAALNTFTDAGCACTDAPCAQRVMADFEAWTQQQIRAGLHRPGKLNAEEQAQAKALMDKILRCVESRLNDAQRYVLENMRYKVRICACTDLPCAEALTAELTKWSENFIKQTRDARMSKADDDRMAEIESEVHTCLQKLRGPK